MFHTTQHTVKYCKKKKRHLKRGTLRAITRHGLSPVVKHTKEGSRNEGMLLMVIDTVKKGRKNSVQRRNSRKISYKFKLHIAYNRDKLRLQWSQSWCRILGGTTLAGTRMSKFLVHENKEDNHPMGILLATTRPKDILEAGKKIVTWLKLKYSICVWVYAIQIKINEERKKKLYVFRKQNLNSGTISPNQKHHIVNDQSEFTPQWYNAYCFDPMLRSNVRYANFEVSAVVNREKILKISLGTTRPRKPKPPKMS